MQIVTGRKGSGKTALFYQVRNKIRRDKQNIVCDLNPEGFQLRKFKTLVLDRMEAGTQEHTITAFWEYLLYLELCYKLLEKDAKVHLHNHDLRAKYLDLQRFYQSDQFISEGDFAERLLRLLEVIEDKFASTAVESNHHVLTRAQITTFLYQHDLSRLKATIIDYLCYKADVWILFDNIDKGWSAHGVEESDLLSLRCLIEALRKLERDLRRAKVTCHSVVFVRSDVFEILVDATPDRGKLNRVTLDWNDPDLLREMLRRRFIFSLGMNPEATTTPDFNTLWNSFAVSHLADGTETSECLVEKSLMRPRSLLDFLFHCKSHAVNLGHNKIEASDILKGEENYSTELVNGISLEIQDMLPSVPNSLFAFIESEPLVSDDDLQHRLLNVAKEENDRKSLLDLLLWYGFIGIIRRDLEETFIYSVAYDIRKLRAIIDNIAINERCYLINPAFYKGLEIKKRA